MNLVYLRHVDSILEPQKEVENTTLYSYNINGNDKYTHLLHDKGRVGIFLTGFLGYNSNPNWPEVILWLPGWGIFLVVFFAILREGFETALFLMGSFNT